jgi:hypothetical protein
LYLEKSVLRGKWVGFREGNKSQFSTLVQNDMLFLLEMISFFQPIRQMILDDMGMNFILEATDKSFFEESIFHALH